MKTKIILAFIFAVVAVILATILYAVLSGTKQIQQPAAPDKVIGGDKDEHGCLTAAGYSWCAAKNKCIRVWEEYCTATVPKTVTFTCAQGKSIKASFYIDDDKFVDLVLNDGSNISEPVRNISLPRAMSGSGARYAKADESIVFWNKGDTAFVEEVGVTTFKDCALPLPQ